MHAHGAADVEHACAEPCLNAEERTCICCDTLHNSTLVGLGDISACDCHAQFISKAGSVIIGKSPSPAFRWSGI